MKNNKLISYTFVLIAYLLAIIAGKYTLDNLNLDNPYMEMLAADVVATVIIFLFSLALNNSSMYDPYWSVIPVPIALYWIWISPEGNDLRQFIILGVILFWSLRLTFNWTRTWPDLTHEDWRYKKLKADTGMLYWPVSFLGIHLFPTLLVFLGMLPVLPAVRISGPVGFFDFAGAVLCLLAVIIEYTADEQLRQFKNRQQTPGMNMEQGLWALSRHPNYFGEILFWFGLFVFSLGGDILGNLWTGIGFISMFILFKFISVPMMEKRLILSKAQYPEYKKNVPAIIPRLWK
jgi:steroid 5-alpha reductase family enzyme